LLLPRKVHNMRKRIMTQTPRQIRQLFAAGKETMKPIKNILLCAALALAFGLPALAAKKWQPRSCADDA
jgi:hypothetical protein